MASQNTTQPQSGGYGKRPAWQWIVIYIVVAIVVYGLVYYFFLRDKGGGSGGVSY
jgi:hypothetical protein